MKDVDYQEVLNQQQIFGEELALFSSNEKQKEACPRIPTYLLTSYSVSMSIVDRLMCTH